MNIIIRMIVGCPSAHRAETERQSHRAGDFRMWATGHDLHGVPLPTEEDFRQEQAEEEQEEQAPPPRLATPMFMLAWIISCLLWNFSYVPCFSFFVYGEFNCLLLWQVPSLVGFEGRRSVIHILSYDI